MTTPLRLLFPSHGLSGATTTSTFSSFSFSPSKPSILFHFLALPSPKSCNPFIFSPSLASLRCFPEKRSASSSRQMVYFSLFLSIHMVACSFRCKAVFWEVRLSVLRLEESSVHVLWLGKVCWESGSAWFSVWTTFCVICCLKECFEIGYCFV